MERRTVLLGSGVALVTTLAGCTGSGDDGDDDPDNSSETGHEGTDDGGDDEHVGDDEHDDVPGMDPGDVSIDSEHLSVDAVSRDGETVRIEATTKTPDREKLREELTDAASDLENAAHDFEAFSARIDVVEWSLYDDDTRVLSFSLDVEWIEKYVEGDLTEDELAEEVSRALE